MATPVIFILGAGPKIGLSVAKAFAAEGYKVALAARSLQNGISEDGYLNIQLDLGNITEIPGAFAKVKETFGIPSVVVFNAAARVLRDPKDPLSSITIEEFNQEFAVSGAAPLFAAQEALKGFKELPSSASKTFIVTGNKLNVVAKPDVFAFGMAKSAAAYMIECASIAYAPQGFKFYFADERQPNGNATIPVNGPAAGDMYMKLAKEKEQGPWNYTFVKDKGYVEFDLATSKAEFLQG